MFARLGNTLSCFKALKSPQSTSVVPVYAWLGSSWSSRQTFCVAFGWRKKSTQTQTKCFKVNELKKYAKHFRFKQLKDYKHFFLIQTEFLWLFNHVIELNCSNFNKSFFTYRLKGTHLSNPQQSLSNNEALVWIFCHFPQKWQNNTKAQREKTGKDAHPHPVKQAESEKWKPVSLHLK